uniref:Uncharacterized protein n=1 Tax=Halomonas phage vB_HboP_4908 TaxID=3350578 RepID=A0AB74URD8_9VIRU
MDSMSACLASFSTLDCFLPIKIFTFMWKAQKNKGLRISG